MKRFLTGAALVAILAASPVLAQTPPPADQNAPAEQNDQATPPATAPDTGSPSDSTGGGSMKPAGSDSSTSGSESMSPDAAAAGSGDAQFLTAEQPGDWQASKLIGQSVTNSANESVGEINDLIVDSSGKVVAAVVGVGGFLGIGTRDVAVRYESLQVSRDDPKTMKVTLNVTKDTLQSAPEYKAMADSDLSGEKK